MRRKNVVPLVSIVTIAVLGVIITLVNGWNPGLGLDLQGGASVVLQPKTKVDTGLLEQTKGIIRKRVDALGVAEPEIVRQGDAIIVSLPGVKDTARALKIVGQTAELRFRPVIGQVPVSETEPLVPTPTTVVGTATTKAGTATTKAGTATTKAGTATTAAPAVEVAPAAGFGQFAVDLQATTAGSAATTKATAATTKTANAGAPVTTNAGASPTTLPGNVTITPGGATVVTPAAAAQSVGPIKTSTAEQDVAGANVVLPELQKNKVIARYSLGPAEVTGRAVRSANALINQNSGEWEVEVNFTSEGSALWDQMAQRHYGERVAIALDGIVKSAPSINARQFDGRAIISGSFTASEAKDLALVLRYGSLPVQLVPQTVQTVSATLGRDSLRTGILTGLIGLALVALYMVFYYRALGLIVLLGLSVSAALMWTIVSFLSEKRGLALSLSGAVGIIVSVGITVDSYVVYFERLKDDIRAGRSLRSSVDRGFKRAFRTILAADLTSFIGAAVLYLRTVGNVRGFAFFLGLSTILDVGVALLFTRPIVALLAQGTFFTNGPLGVARGMSHPDGRPIVALSPASTGGLPR